MKRKHEMLGSICSGAARVSVWGNTIGGRPLKGSDGRSPPPPTSENFRKFAKYFLKN